MPLPDDADVLPGARSRRSSAAVAEGSSGNPLNKDTNNCTGPNCLDKWASLGPSPRQSTVQRPTDRRSSTRTRRWAFAKLYDRKTPITAADPLERGVIPFSASMRSRYGACSPTGHRVLRRPGAPRAGALPDHRGHRPHAHEDQEAAEERRLRALPQHHASTSSTGWPSGPTGGWRCPREPLCNSPAFA